jgi:hypothetical protein
MKIEKRDQEKIKRELVALFSLFLENPENITLRKKAELLEKEYTGLISHADHASEEIVPKELLQALSSIGLVAEYGMYEDSHPAFSREKILKKARKHIKELMRL